MSIYTDRCEREDEEDRQATLPMKTSDANVQRTLAIIRVWYSLAW